MTSICTEPLFLECLFLNFFVADFVLYFYFSCILRQGVTLRLKLLTQPPE